MAAAIAIFDNTASTFLAHFFAISPSHGRFVVE